MAKNITTKYGTKIDVTGLTPKQVERVRSMAEDNGAYGGKGAALADTLRAKNDKGVSTEAKKTSKTVDLGLNQDGTIDINQATKAITNTAEKDINKTFNMQNPDTQTDAYGNTRDITKDSKGNVEIKDTAGKPLANTLDAFIQSLSGFIQQGPLDLSGAPKILQSEDARSEWNQAADANYNYITKDYASQKQKELEDAKQELANRGIPMGSKIYDKTIKDIDSKYQGMYDQAKNQGITAGNQTLSTIVGAQSNAYDAFMDTAKTKHSSGLNDAATLVGVAGGLKQAPTTYQGGSSNISAQLQALLSQASDADLKKLTLDLQRRSSGGGGSSNTGGGFAIGNAPDQNG